VRRVRYAPTCTGHLAHAGRQEPQFEVIRARVERVLARRPRCGHPVNGTEFRILHSVHRVRLGFIFHVGEKEVVIVAISVAPTSGADHAAVGI